MPWILKSAMLITTLELILVLFFGPEFVIVAFTFEPPCAHLNLGVV